MKIADLKDAEYNPREISDVSLEGLKFSMEEFGDLSSLVFNKKTGNLVAGHQRLRSLKEKHGKKLKMVKQKDPERPWAIVTPSGDRFPVRVIDWPLAKEKAGNLASNNPHIQGAFTAAAIPMLQQLEVEAPELMVDLNLAPLQIDLIDAFSQEVNEGNTDPDEVPDPPKKAVTKRGDLWILGGKHRLLCGDSCSKKDVEKLMKGIDLDFIMTSPPYNVGVEYGGATNDRKNNAEYLAWLKSLLSVWVEQLSSGRALAWNIGVAGEVRHIDQFIMLGRLGLDFVRQFVWKKQCVPIPSFYQTRKNPVARMLSSNYVHEMVYIFSKGKLKKGGKVKFDETLRDDVFNVNQTEARVDLPEGEHRPGVGPKAGLVCASKAHPAVYPTKLVTAFMQHYMQPGEYVADPFMGSGTTIIAAEQLDRRCFGIEIEPKYVDVCVKRWENFTGKKAKCIKAKKTKGQGRKKAGRKGARA